MSRGLRDILGVKPKTKSQGYFFTGTVGEIQVRAFCDEEGVPYEDFVRARTSVELLYRFPELFDLREAE